MFETVVPETYVKRSRRVFYETLPVSLALHAIAVLAVLLGTIWNVAFPRHSPSLVSAYSLTSLPDPPPPPPPPAPMEAAPKVEAKFDAPPPPPQLLEMAPRVIPNLVPRIEPPPPTPPPPVQTAAASPEGVANGDPNGKKDGMLGGDVGGHLRGLAGSVVFPDDGRVYIERDAKLPMEPIKQEPPAYPAEAQKKQLEDSVTVRYVIGTNGRVKDVTILDHAREPMFDANTIDAISKWSFRPLKKDGKAVEVVHEMTVFYQLIRH